jgi:hypothetical protein
MQDTLTLDATVILDAAVINRAAAGAGKTKRRQLNHWFFMAGVGLLVLLAWLMGRWGGFEPGSETGYNLGLAGGIMMLLLFLYPLRKHFRFMHGMGSAKYWFAMHMTMGILGPLFILAHSRFQVGSVNAGVALASMCLVAGSGIIGRFIYTKIHHGLYGRRASLEEMRARSGLSSREVQSRLAFAPKVEGTLSRFEAVAMKRHANPLSGAWAFVMLWVRAHHAHRRCARELRRLYKTHARERGWDQAKFQRRLRAANDLVHTYLRSTREVAHFHTYERLFSLWHVLHVPLVYMLILSAIAHVVAVHMY